MQVNLFYLATPNYGGWPTYTAHLFKAFQLAGHGVSLYRVAQTLEHKQRTFTGGVPYRNVPEKGLREFAAFVRKSGPIIVTAMDKKHYHLAAELASLEGVVLVVHDPTEINDSTRVILHSSRSTARVVTIRRAVQRHLPVQSTFIRHPYVRSGAGSRKSKVAVSISRLDWDKHIDIIAAANDRLLPADRRVDIYGAENRLYTNHKLTKEHLLWRQQYFGSFPRDFDAAVKLAREYQFVVDMSVIKGDGGGTQYTFLEAWDAAACLVVNSGWLLPDDDMVPGGNCLAVGSAIELADVLRKDPPQDVVRGGLNRLYWHEPTRVAGDFLSLMSS